MVSLLSLVFTVIPEAAAASAEANYTWLEAESALPDMTGMTMVGFVPLHR